MAAPCRPVHDDEAQTHHHEGNAQSSETKGLRTMGQKDPRALIIQEKLDRYIIVTTC